jgi:hypothetical protein
MPNKADVVDHNFTSASAKLYDASIFPANARMSKQQSPKGVHFEHKPELANATAEIGPLCPSSTCHRVAVFRS